MTDDGLPSRATRLALMERCYLLAKTERDKTPRYRPFRRARLKTEMWIWARSHIEISLGIRE